MPASNRVQSPPSNTSQFANEVKQQLAQQRANQQINLLNQSITSSPTRHAEATQLIEANQTHAKYDTGRDCECTNNNESLQLGGPENSGVGVSFARDDSQV